MKPKKVKLQNTIRWQVDYYQNGRGTRRVRKRFLKKIDAENFIISYLKKKDELKAPNTLYDPNLTFKSEVEYWFRFKEKELSISYIIRMKGILHSLIKKMGKMPVMEINKRFLTHQRHELLKKNVTICTVNKWMAGISTVLNFSYEQDRIPYHPCKGFKPLKEIREEVSFWEREEIKKFLEYANKKYSKESLSRWKYLAYLIALNTGVRSGELWGLKVKDLSFERKIIIIKRQVLKVNGKVSNTKGKNVRKVPFHEFVQNEVRALIKLKSLSADDFLFCSQADSSIDHKNFVNRVFKKDLLESGLRKIRFHDLRHSAITMMVDSGINIKTVQSIAGHADMTTTLRYVHALGNSIELVASSHLLS